jgi:hypothetical protein
MTMTAGVLFIFPSSAHLSNFYAKKNRLGKKDENRGDAASRRGGPKRRKDVQILDVISGSGPGRLY